MVDSPINLFDYEALAKERLPKAEYDLIAGGATDEITVRRNRAAYNDIMLRPRTMVDVTQRDLSTTMLGQRIEFPVVVAPAGFHARVHPEGELATARAAGAEGTLMVVSSAATYTLEEISKTATGPLWFQQYFYRDRGLTMEMAQRAQEAGYTALCVTLDSKGKSKRERDIRNNPSRSTLPNYAGLDLEENSLELGAHPRKKLHDIRDHSATWDYLDWFVANAPLPVVPKGVMTSEDARLCVEHGVKALIVSNHGGGVLDTTLASIEMLPEVVEVVDGRLEVYVDGGIRRGADVVKALALGAKAVLIGRPIFWGLAVDGEAGVRGVLRILREEIDMTMALCGCPTVDSIDRGLVATTSPLIKALS
ncbi:MAG: alpha-hydroxy acid oxidase [Chloroflexi bacterium]|nr:alpha-hydroxy acid oxidase [Chloroflexota bacterium]